MLKILLFLLSITIYVGCVSLPEADSQRPFLISAINNNLTNSSVCTTDVCAKESVEIAKSINYGIDPCENFYDFVCGKYIDDTVLPDDQFKETAFTLAQDEINRKLQTALLEELEPNEPRAFKLAKTFTQLCMDEATLNQKGRNQKISMSRDYAAAVKLKPMFFVFFQEFNQCLTSWNGMVDGQSSRVMNGMQPIGNGWKC